jgi:hypothetical protein
MFVIISIKEKYPGPITASPRGLKLPRSPSVPDGQKSHTTHTHMCSETVIYRRSEGMPLIVGFSGRRDKSNAGRFCRSKGDLHLIS